MTAFEPAPAKVNLYLHVTGRRADGYHLLDSLAVFPDIGDRLQVTEDAALSLHLDGPFGVDLVPEADNLVLRAARALAAACNLPARGRITLTKNLPVASGIGGGSADAAAALRLLSRHWNVSPPPADLARISLQLGADVPVCLASTPRRMAGVGEVLAAAPMLPQGFMVLVNPGVHVATPAVFKARTGDYTLPAELPPAWSDMAQLAQGLAAMRNDLQPPALSLAPEIGVALSELRATQGCLLARMSGSGATCFGLYETETLAKSAAVTMSRPGWWTWAGAMAASVIPRGLPGQPLTA